MKQKINQYIAKIAYLQNSSKSHLINTHLIHPVLIVFKFFRIFTLILLANRNLLLIKQNLFSKIMFQIISLSILNSLTVSFRYFSYVLIITCIIFIYIGILLFTLSIIHLNQSNTKYSSATQLTWIFFPIILTIISNLV